MQIHTWWFCEFNPYRSETVFKILSLLYEIISSCIWVGFVPLCFFIACINSYLLQHANARRINNSFWLGTLYGSEWHLFPWFVPSVHPAHENTVIQPAMVKVICWENEEIKWGIQILVLYMLFSAAIHLRAKIKPAYKTHRPQLLFPTLASVRKPIETMGVVPRDTSIWIPFTMWYMMWLLANLVISWESPLNFLRISECVPGILNSSQKSGTSFCRI